MSQGDLERAPRESFRAGVRAGLPYAFANLMLAAAFGIAAREVGFSALATVLMSALVFAGSAQVAALTVIAGGGGVPAALGSAALAHSRFLAMGIALAPSLPGNWIKRALQGMTTVDASWAMAATGDGRFDRFFLFGASAPQYVTWVSGTAVGAVFSSRLGDPNDLGLDAVFPAFFLALLFAELRGPRTFGAAGAGALIALLLVPFTPVGVPVLVASTAALVGLWTAPSPGGTPA